MSKVFWMLGLSLAVMQASAAASMQYRVDAVVDPGQQTVRASVDIVNPASNRFCLNKNFSILKAIVDGKTVSVHTDSRGLRVAGSSRPRQMRLIYEGALERPADKWAASGSTLNDGLAELAMYSCWYPRIDGAKDFDFTLTADLPGGFKAVSNAKPVAQTPHAGRQTYVWKTERPAFDMVLIAARDFRTAHAGDVEYLYRDLPDAVVARHAANAEQGWRMLRELYGDLSVAVAPRIVYTPRDGQGAYSRIPLIVIPETFVADLVAGRFTPMKDISGDAAMYWGAVHEMSHYWWIVANMNSRDEWIDEGIAEFTAIRAMKAKYPADGEKMLADYRNAQSTNKTAAAIADTDPNSPDRYLNWYQKTTLVFFAAQDKFGEPALNKLLKAFRERFAGTRDATTAAFLDEAEKQIGPEARTFFKTELYRPAAVAEKK